VQTIYCAFALSHALRDLCDARQATLIRCDALGASGLELAESAAGPTGAAQGELWLLLGDVSMPRGAKEEAEQVALAHYAEVRAVERLLQLAGARTVRFFTEHSLFLKLEAGVDYFPTFRSRGHDEVWRILEERRRSAKSPQPVTSSAADDSLPGAAQHLPGSTDPRARDARAARTHVTCELCRAKLGPKTAKTHAAVCPKRAELEVEPKVKQDRDVWVICTACDARHKAGNTGHHAKKCKPKAAQPSVRAKPAVRPPERRIVRPTSSEPVRAEPSKAPEFAKPANSSSGEPKDRAFNEDSPLSRAGYKAGGSGLPIKERRVKLQAVFEAKLKDPIFHGYPWGHSRSRERRENMIGHLTWQIRLFKNVKDRDMSIALKDWDRDITFVKSL
jgi:hypothetical protein